MPFLTPSVAAASRYAVLAFSTTAISGAAPRLAPRRAVAVPTPTFSVGAETTHVARNLERPAWDSVWIRRGTEFDTVLASPDVIAASARLVVIGDSPHHALHAFSAKTGAVLWSLRSTERQPIGEVGAMIVAPDGRILVYDRRRSQLITVSGAGKYVGAVDLSMYRPVQGICPQKDGSLIVTTNQAHRPVLHLRPTGAVIDRWALPWSELDTLNVLLTQSLIVPAPDGGCVLAHLIGLGLAVLRGGSRSAPAWTVAPYVERMDLPTATTTKHVRPNGEFDIEEKIDRMQVAAIDAAVTGSNIEILFGGHTGDANRIIDRYDLKTGAYRSSYHLPLTARRFARSGPNYVFLARARGLPAIAVMAPRAPR